MHNLLLRLMFIACYCVFLFILPLQFLLSSCYHAVLSQTNSVSDSFSLFSPINRLMYSLVKMLKKGGWWAGNENPTAPVDS